MVLDLDELREAPWLKDSPFWVTMLFTGVSVILTYWWRRFFNAGLYRVAHKLAMEAMR